MRCVALLRGINVGGKNIIRMEALRATFEGLGFTGVSTFIQSGNVLFEAGGAKPGLTERIERALSGAFAYESKIVLVSEKELAAVVAEAPPGFGSEPERYRYDVLFLKPPLTADEVMAEVETRPDVDEVHPGTHALYFRRVTARASSSRLPRLVMKPVYKRLTVRNWKTTKQLLALLQK